MLSEVGLTRGAYGYRAAYRQPPRRLQPSPSFSGCAGRSAAALPPTHPPSQRSGRIRYFAQKGMRRREARWYTNLEGSVWDYAAA